MGSDCISSWSLLIFWLCYHTNNHGIVLRWDLIISVPDPCLSFYFVTIQIIMVLFWYGIWLYQFLIIAYLLTLTNNHGIVLIWDLIISVPDHCLSFDFVTIQIIMVLFWYGISLYQFLIIAYLLTLLPYKQSWYCSDMGSDYISCWSLLILLLCNHTNNHGIVLIWDLIISVPNHCLSFDFVTIQIIMVLFWYGIWLYQFLIIAYLLTLLPYK